MLVDPREISDRFRSPEPGRPLDDSAVVGVVHLAHRTDCTIRFAPDRIMNHECRFAHFAAFVRAKVARAISLIAKSLVLIHSGCVA